MKFEIVDDGMDYVEMSASISIKSDKAGLRTGWNFKIAISDVLSILKRSEIR